MNAQCVPLVANNFLGRAVFFRIRHGLAAREEENKKKMEYTKKIATLIPIEKEKLFAYNVDWALFDTEKEKIVGSHLKPWCASFAHFGCCKRTWPSVCRFVCMRTIGKLSAWLRRE